MAPPRTSTAAFGAQAAEGRATSTPRGHRSRTTRALSIASSPGHSTSRSPTGTAKVKSHRLLQDVMFSFDFCCPGWRRAGCFLCFPQRAGKRRDLFGLLGRPSGCVGGKLDELIPCKGLVACYLLLLVSVSRMRAGGRASSPPWATKGIAPNLLGKEFAILFAKRGVGQVSASGRVFPRQKTASLDMERPAQQDLPQDRSRW